MPPTLHNIVRLLSMSPLFRVVIVLLAPFPALAIPIAPQDPPASSEPPNPESSHMDHKVIFGIIFVIGKWMLTVRPGIPAHRYCVPSALPHY